MISARGIELPVAIFDYIGIGHIAELVREYKVNHTVVILSATPAETRDEVEKTLKCWNIPHNYLILRRTNDKRDIKTFYEEWIDDINTSIGPVIHNTCHY